MASSTVGCCRRDAFGANFRNTQDKTCPLLALRMNRFLKSHNSFFRLNTNSQYMYFSERLLYVANNLIRLGRRPHCPDTCLIIATAVRAPPSSGLPVPAHPAAGAARRAFKTCRFSPCNGWSPGDCMAAAGAAAAVAAGNGPPPSFPTTLP